MTASNSQLLVFVPWLVSSPCIGARPMDLLLIKRIQQNRAWGIKTDHPPAHTLSGPTSVPALAATVSCPTERPPWQGTEVASGQQSAMS